ncbi:MAG: hypothetical protein HC888_00255 [Candidatus Competibacteraceae bacterium]|nr:hypothetical protein [Candidatus Competibacteraceae bacterium]
MSKKSEAESKEPKRSPSKKVKIITMDDVYRLLNRVQVNKKEVVFSVKTEDSTVAETS